MQVPETLEPALQLGAALLGASGKVPEEEARRAAQVGLEAERAAKIAEAERLQQVAAAENAVIAKYISDAQAAGVPEEEIRSHIQQAQVLQGRFSLGIWSNSAMVPDLRKC